MLLLPPQPAMPAATQANSKIPAQAYPNRFAIGSRFRLSRNRISIRPATIHTGPSGTLGMRCGGPVGGARSDSVVINVAVQVVALAAAVHVAAAPRAVVPFMNCTAPPGAATFIAAAVTVAVSVTLPPEAIDAALDVTTVVVVCFAPPVTVTVIAADVDAA